MPSLDLAVGNPVFLQEALDRFYPQAFTCAQYRTQKGVSYPVSGGDEGLRDALRGFHIRVHGRAYEHIVITTGAKQALLAAVYADTTINIDRYELYHRTPYWPGCPSIAAMSGLEFVTNFGIQSLRVATVPNNPDGSEFTEGVPDVLDAAYCHPIYGAQPPGNAGCSVWSAAKLFGLCGSRIGWLATDNRELAAKAIEYVDRTTSGVSRQSQAVLMAMVAISGNPDFDKAMKSARKSLLANADLFMSGIEDFLDELQGLPANRRGMFAFFRPQDCQKFEHALRKSDVQLTPGSACGVRDDWYRMNLGASPLQLEFGLSKIRKAMR